jgi:hypothetical protein
VGFYFFQFCDIENVEKKFLKFFFKKLVEFPINFYYNFFCSFVTFLKSSPIQKETTIVSSIVTFFFYLLFSSQEGYDPGAMFGIFHCQCQCWGVGGGG